jgi:hypothetical protein
MNLNKHHYIRTEWNSIISPNCLFNVAAFNGSAILRNTVQNSHDVEVTREVACPSQRRRGGAAGSCLLPLLALWNVRQVVGDAVTEKQLKHYSDKILKPETQFYLKNLALLSHHIMHQRHKQHDVISNLNSNS